MVTGATVVTTGAIVVTTGATVVVGVDFGTALTATAFQMSFFPTFLQTSGFLVVPAIVPAFLQAPLTLAADTSEFAGVNNETTKVTPTTMRIDLFMGLTIAGLQFIDSKSMIFCPSY